ncbi:MULTISPECIES: polysaccharide biosynthesis tyrosine autokinase [unclassified Fibrobacter]|uniref:polysaccharide biosynthesis tyrosine autokinase n=1 Tax=unclassified Fibrobacter TaxID=2634177 RepID=UPI000D6BBD8F|nr:MULTISPECIES: polysaccharide biosynthesis tyrosine autokinase [unclassified Fibrobacter]PWJ67067.1 tyrosine-protein kinase Etk/Wzc [Fibrobacter sp. UWR4]PZW70634.1 tyrosine-protein kinase Etk/Wzc [Fibrobacter sp. UWR1]
MDLNSQNNLQSVNQVSVVPTKDDEIDLLEVLGILLKHKVFLILCVIVGCGIGFLASNWARPQYTSDALLQIDVKGNKAGKAMGEMGALLDVANPAEAEIELLKSRMVLSYVVQKENLCFNAYPKDPIKRLTHTEGRMDLENLHIPEIAITEKWMARTIDDSTYAIITPEETELARGVLGKELVAPYGGDSLVILVKRMRAEPDQMFVLVESDPLDAVRSLVKQLNVAEKGKQTGIIGVSFTHQYPDRAAAILNSIANVYLRQNVEMRSAEAEKTLEFLEQQLPGVKAKLDSAEKNLADYRHKIGSVDMTGETRAHLEKDAALQRQILELEQQRQEATRLFKEEHPSVQTIVKQQNRLRAELSKLKNSAEKMPLTQQEVLRLQEEVAVQNAQYTSMLNNIQQLRVVRAGEVGNVRVVDYAQIERKPSKPNKKMIFLGCVAGAFLLGALLIYLLQMTKRGVRSSLEIERATGVSVYAKIPESDNNILHHRKKGKNTLPLVEQSPDDPASEAFRSLYTAIDFSIANQKVVMVTGMVPGVGKSFVSKNLAALYATNGKRVLLIDADMRRGVVYSKHRQGLGDVLSGKVPLDNVISETLVKNMFALGAGNSEVAPSELLRGENFKRLLEDAKSQFDMIVVDTPPLNLVTDSELIYPVVDFALFVLHYGRHSMEQIKESMIKVERCGDKPHAFVMNHVEHDGRGYGYGYGGYGYGKYGYYSNRKKKK